MQKGGSKKKLNVEILSAEVKSEVKKRAVSDSLFCFKFLVGDYIFIRAKHKPANLFAVRKFRHLQCRNLP